MARTGARNKRLRVQRGSHSGPNDRWDFGLPEYLLDVSVKASDLRPFHRDYPTSLNDFSDDQQITAAALRLHPLLGRAAANALDALLPWDASVRKHQGGAILVELGPNDDPAIHLLIAGRARLVATTVTPGSKPEREKSWVVAQYGSGQWIGFSQLLREFDRTRRGGFDWPQERVRLKVEILSDTTTQRMEFGAALALMREHSDFCTFVEHHVAVRFARRREILERVAEEPMLRLLNSSMREYLLQLGAVVESEPEATEPYLPAGQTTSRVALILRGEAKLLVPLNGPPGRSSSLGVGATVGPGHLIGHEELVMEAERANLPASQVEIFEPKRTSTVRLGPQTQVLQFFWHALRWVLDSRAPVWQRVQAVLRGEPADLTARMPTIVIFHAAKAGLGTSTLAYGAATALAQQGSTVKVIDLQGASNFDARWQPLGFQQRDERAQLNSEIRDRRAPGRPESFTTADYVVLEPPAALEWSKSLDVVWPKLDDDIEAAETLIDVMEAQEGVNYVIVAGHDAAMERLSSRLDGRCSNVFYVSDDTSKRYPGPEPERLTWVYRMTSAYISTERERAAKTREAWASQVDTAGLLQFLRPNPGGEVPAELELEAVLGPRRVVRVPDDAVGAALFERGRLAQLFRQGGALVSACERLARVIQGRSVGLALGGGGAWGFAHIALIKNLEQQGVPIDFVAGTSFGAVVGGLYAVGGMPALDFLIDNNSPSGPGIGATLRALVSGRLNRAMLLAPFDTVAVERFMNGQLRAAGATSDDEPPCLATTEVPFYPVGTNLSTHELLTLPHATLGWGVRMSGSLPPVYSTLLRRGDRIADGAFIANVPSRLVRDVGADFVVASNVVPPPPHQNALTSETAAQRLSRLVFGRVEDAIRGVFVLAWKAGVDQGELAADCTLDLRPTAANLVETWRGRNVVEEVLNRLSQPKNVRRIREAWDTFYEARKAGIADPGHAFSDDEPGANTG